MNSEGPACGCYKEFGDEYRNIGKNIIAICFEHRYWWWAGYGLFSTWELETKADWERNAQELALYTERPDWAVPSREAIQAELARQEKPSKEAIQAEWELLEGVLGEEPSLEQAELAHLERVRELMRLGMPLWREMRWGVETQDGETSEPPF